MAGTHDDILDTLQNRLTSLVKIIEDRKNERNQFEKDPRVRDPPGELPYRVLHFNNNPFDLEIRRKEQEHADLRRENDRLKAKIDLLESGNDADVTRRIDDAVNNAHQIEILNDKVEELKKREAKILDSARRCAKEFREVSYLLTGYRMGIHNGRTYVLSHMYAEQRDDKLFFEISPDGVIQLLQNEYSDTLSDLIRTYLEHGDSFPAFLAALTLDLFKSTTQSTTQSTDMSISMSTTVQPNPLYKKH